MKRIIFACCLSISSCALVHAGEPQPSAPPPIEQGEFMKGTHEFETLVGYFKSVDTVIPPPVGRPPLETGLAAFRYGWMLNGPGSYFAGGTLLLRHNFVWGQHPIFVPYFQIGAGFVGSDASSDHSQFSIGTPVEFNLQASLGTRWRLNHDWSINTEFNYRHISNGGLSSRNGGYDLVGGFIGLGRMF